MDKREEPSATATEIGKTPSTKHKESGLSSCYCCFNTFIKEHNKTKGFVTNDDLDSSIWATVQGIFPNYFPLTGSTKEVKIALAEVRKHSPFIYKVAKHFSQQRISCVMKTMISALESQLLKDLGSVFSS